MQNLSVGTYILSYSACHTSIPLLFAVNEIQTRRRQQWKGIESRTSLKQYVPTDEFRARGRFKDTVQEGKDEVKRELVHVQILLKPY